jgi:Protein of unknown function (DUF4242)
MHPCITGQIGGERRREKLARAGQQRLVRRLIRTAKAARRAQRAAARQQPTPRRIQMPRFMDFHDDLVLPPEAIEQLTEGTQQALADEFGVVQIELYHNRDGKAYCLLEGPDEESIRKHHAALDVPCGDVHQVSSLL